MIEDTEQSLRGPLILNIESATDICSVCLSRGMEVLSHQVSEGKNEHARIITMLVQQCMDEAGYALEELNAVAVSEGPGSYTSLRVGFSTAKGICFALNKPLITISTLKALALASHSAQFPDAIYCPMIDARRMEVYMALFSAGGDVLLPPQAQVISDTVFEPYFSTGQQIIFCGNGAEKCKMIINSPLSYFSKIKNCDSVQLIPSAMSAFLNKNFVDTAYATPYYLKSPNITSAKPKPS